MTCPRVEELERMLRGSGEVVRYLIADRDRWRAKAEDFEARHLRKYPWIGSGLSQREYYKRKKEGKL
jgi:hypothetical protein